MKGKSIFAMVLCVALMGLFVGCKEGLTAEDISKMIDERIAKMDKDEPAPQPTPDEPTLPCGGKIAEAVDLGLSVDWAAWNIGASSIEDCGNYYAWGETTTKDGYFWETYALCNGTSSTLTKYCATDNKTILDFTDDAARVLCYQIAHLPKI